MSLNPALDFSPGMPLHRMHNPHLPDSNNGRDFNNGRVSESHNHYTRQNTYESRGYNNHYNHEQCLVPTWIGGILLVLGIVFLIWFIWYFRDIEDGAFITHYSRDDVVQK